MRADIAELRGALEDVMRVAKQEHVSLLNLEEEMRLWASDILSMCGPNSPFNRTIRDMEIDSDVLRFAEPLSAESYHVKAMPNSVAMKTITAFVVSLQAYPDETDHRVFVRMDYSKGDRGPWAYAVDERTLKTMGPRQEHEIARAVAREMADAIRRGK